MALNNEMDAYTWLFEFVATNEDRQLESRNRDFLVNPEKPCVIRQETILEFNDPEDNRVALEARNCTQFSARFRQDDGDEPQRDEVFNHTFHCGGGGCLSIFSFR